MDTQPSQELGAARILVVEDHHVFAAALKRLVELGGSYAVETVSTAEEAVVRVQESPYSAVMVNISLPGRDGIWLAEELRRLRPELPVLIVSGYVKPEFLERALAAG